MKVQSKALTLKIKMLSFQKVKCIVFILKPKGEIFFGVGISLVRGICKYAQMLALIHSMLPFVY